MDYILERIQHILSSSESIEAAVLDITIDLRITTEYVLEEMKKNKKRF